MWMEYLRVDSFAGEPGEGNDLLLAPIQETGADDDRIYSWLEKLDGEKERFEDERLLYVAATRAKAAPASAGQHGLFAVSDGRFRTEAACQESIAEQNLACGQSRIMREAAARRYLRAILFIADGEESWKTGEIRNRSVAASPCIRLGVAGRRRHLYSGRRSSISRPHRARSNIPGRAKLRAVLAISYIAGCSASRKTG